MTTKLTRNEYGRKIVRIECNCYAKCGVTVDIESNGFAEIHHNGEMKVGMQFPTWVYEEALKHAELE